MKLIVIRCVRCARSFHVDPSNPRKPYPPRCDKGGRCYGREDK